MALLRRFWHWLTARHAPAMPMYGDPRKTRIDKDIIAARLDLATKASELGQKCLPQSGHGLSGVEQLVMHELQVAQDGYVAWAGDRLKVLNEEINGCDIAAVIDRASHVHDEFKSEASATIDNWKSELKRASELRHSRRREYEQFRRDNQLSDQPHFLSPGWTALGYSALVALVVVEGLLNSFFFGKGMFGGLLSGFVVAGLFSLFNIALGYVVGAYVLPHMRHVKWSWKAPAVVGCVVYVIVLIGLALAIGHYRDAVAGMSMEPEVTAWASLQQDPLELRNFQSAMLVLISGAFGLFAVFDAYRLRGQYPGHVTRYKRLLQAEEEFELHRGDLNDAIQEIRQRKLKELDQHFQNAQSALRALDSAVQDKDVTRQALQGGFAQVDTAMRALIAVFRDENMKARPPECRDIVFAQLPSLVAPLLQFDVEQGKSKYLAQKQLLEELTDRLQLMRGQIQSSFTEQIGLTETIESVSASLTSKSSADETTA